MYNGLLEYGRERGDKYMVHKNESMLASRMRVALLSVFVAVACAVCGAAFASETAYAATAEQTATLSITGMNDQTEARKILPLVNQARAKVSVGNLDWDYDLEKAAIKRAAEISILFEHARPNGALLQELNSKISGENIHADDRVSTAVTANTSWTNSPGHYGNMINESFTCMAAATFKIDGITYWVELFGRSASDLPETNPLIGTNTYQVESLPSNIELSFSSKLASSAAKGSSAQYRVVNTNQGWDYAKTTINASSFTWSTSNANVATIDANGKAIVVGAGAVTIAAKNKALASVGVSNAVTLKATSSASTPKEGWVKSGSRWWYRYTDGSCAKGLTSIQGTMYFFDNIGWMKTGWQHAKGGNDWYYFAGSGAMKTGWVKVSGKWYYLDAQGKMLTGKQTLSDKKTYFLANSGAMQTGWVKNGSNWYYCNASGAMTTSWQKVKGTWYYMASNGVMKTGWLNDSGSTYYLASSGAMVKGWKYIGSNWYYFNNSGVMKTGWQKIGGKWYLLASDGKMLTGWQDVNGKSYYMNGSGVMQANKWIGNYYVQGDGSMATNKWIGKYHVNADGLWDDTKKPAVSSTSGSSNSGSSTANANKPVATSTVYWTPSGDKYHSSKGCSTLSRSKTIYSGSLADVGYRTACQKCF